MTLLSLLLAIAKAIPALNDLWDKLADGWVSIQAEQGRKKAYETIDADRARILSQPWVCPARCPHKFMHDGIPPASSGQPAAPAPGSP